MSQIRDRARRKVELILIAYENDKIHLFDAEEQILSIKEIAVVDRKAKLPEKEFISSNENYRYREAQLDMAGYVLEVKK